MNKKKKIVNKKHRKTKTRVKALQVALLAKTKKKAAVKKKSETPIETKENKTLVKTKKTTAKKTPAKKTPAKKTPAKKKK